MKSSDLKHLAQEHLDDARALESTQRYAGAIYLAGYAVECALKFRICETLGWTDFPPSNDHRALKSHDLNFLLSYTGRLLEIKKQQLLHWQRFEKWNPEIRYEAGLTPLPANVSNYINSVTHIVNLLT